MREADALLRLQETDLKLFQCEKGLADVPERDELKRVVALSKELNSRLVRTLGERKDLEMELADADARKAELEARINEVTEESRNGAADFKRIREYETALSNLAKQLDKNAYDADAAMHRLIEVEETENKIRTAMAKLKEKGETLAQSAQTRIAELEAERKKLTEDREYLVGDISDAMLARYDKTRKALGPLAVETLNGNKPTACRVKLQPSSYADVMRAGEITECPYCHRILIPGDRL